ncbi:MAG: hypothetical protein ACRD06_07210 [Terriglobia bacterium]
MALFIDPPDNPARARQGYRFLLREIDFGAASVASSKGYACRARAAITPDLKRDTQNVMAFWDLMVSQRRPHEAIERYVGGQHIQQDPRIVVARKGSSRSSATPPVITSAGVAPLIVKMGDADTPPSGEVAKETDLAAAYRLAGPSAAELEASSAA